MTSPISATVAFDLSAVPSSIETVDALARLHVSARQLGLRVQFQRASAELLELIALTGLDEVLGVEPLGQAEKREQRGGVEEEGELPDPAA